MAAGTVSGTPAGAQNAERETPVACADRLMSGAPAGAQNAERETLVACADRPLSGAPPYLFSGIDDGREWFEAGQSPLNKPAWRVAVRLRAKSRFLPLCHNVAIAYSPGQVESSTSCPGNRDPKIPNPNEGCIGVTSGPVHCARPVESAVADFPRCNPVGVDEICIAIPRVARPSQPRALRLFPVGEDQSTSRAGLFQTVGLQGAKQIRVCDPRFGVPCRTLKVCFSRRRGRSFLGPWVACFGCCGAIG